MPDNVYLTGNWNDKRYSPGIEDILQKEFTLKNPLSDSAKYWEEKITSAKCSVAVHVRAGDFRVLRLCRKSGVISFSYYYSCINELKKSLSDMTVFVFCIEPDWAKENLKFDVPTEFVTGLEDDDEEFYLMTLCRHDIIAASTYSLWVARLNQNPDKKVFSPNLRPDDENIKTVNFNRNDYPDYFIPPAISMILYIDDNMPNAEFTVMTLLNQNLSICEIIVIDSSKDGSGEKIRKFAQLNIITFIKVSNAVTKYEAWNISLENARGEYVIFFDGKNFMTGDAVNTFRRFDYEFYCKFVATKGTFVRTMADYDKYMKTSANMYFSTKRLVAAPKGDINLFGGRFFMEVDKFFKYLDGVEELEISDFEKLYLIFQKLMNADVGGKFFKRDFLNEHKLRFDENKNVNAEMKFVVDAMLCSEKIAVIPDCIYGRL